MPRQTLRGLLPVSLAVMTLVLAIPGSATAQSGNSGQASIIHKIKYSSERQEMTVNSSRILTLDSKIPQFQVNNPELLELTALSPTQVQIFAKKPGVTQVNLWDEDERIYTVDVVVIGDAKELDMLLQEQFPSASLRVRPISSGVLISGYVDDPNAVTIIVRIAEEFYPSVLTNIKVGGVHQVLLHVKVMEVSRTKLRTCGFDWSQVSGSNVVSSTVSGLIGGVSSGSVVTSGAESLFFGVVDGGNAFFGVLEALREDSLMKILAEPTLVTVSGRAASFQVGGEFPIIVPQSLGTTTIEYKQFGTQVDFVPIVLGNGRIRLEVRPRVSEIDNTRSVTIDSYTVPGLRVRQVDTGVEMMAGQTLAIAGLVQTRVESERRGVPWVSDVPYLGAMFRRVHEENNEVELLVMVTPELVEAVDADQMPNCGPGMQTASPSDWELYMRGHIEVPNCCPTGPGMGMPNQMPQGVSPGMILQEPERIETPYPNGPLTNGTGRPATGYPETLSTANSDVPARPIVRQNRYDSQNRAASATSVDGDTLPGFIGPIGYDTAQ